MPSRTRRARVRAHRSAPRHGARPRRRMSAAGSRVDPCPQQAHCALTTCRQLYFLQNLSKSVVSTTAVSGLHAAVERRHTALARAALETVLELMPLDAEQACRGRYVAFAARERGVDDEVRDLFFEPFEIVAATVRARIDGALG